MTRLVAVDYTSGKALFDVRGHGVIVDINNRDVLKTQPMQTALTAAAWMRVSSDFDYPAVWRELADAEATNLEVREKLVEMSDRKFRIPKSVKNEALAGLEWCEVFNRGHGVLATSMAKTLSTETYLPASQVLRIAKYFSRRPSNITEMAGWSEDSEEFPNDVRIRYSMWGGSPAREWATRIAVKHGLIAAGGFGVGDEQLPPANVDPDMPHMFEDDPESPGECVYCGRAEEDPVHQGMTAGGFSYDDSCDYFGIGVDEDSTKVTGLMKMDPEGSWQHRINGEWADVDEPADDVILIMLDPESAEKLAGIVDDEDDTDDPLPSMLPYELSMLNPHEAALFAAAEPEEDWELVQRVFDIYDSQERSVNARKQVRGPGGRFGDQPDAPQQQAQDPQAPQPVKARLPQKMDQVPDINARIDEYLAEVERERQQQGGVQAEPAGDDGYPNEEYATKILNNYHGNALVEFVEGTQQAVSDVRPLYLAIVDGIDTEAVLDVVALVPPAPGTQADVSVWRRNAGKWEPAPDILGQLRGTAPPPVVELSDDNMLGEVLRQVDESTMDNAEPQEQPQQNAPKPQQTTTPVNPDGSSGPKPDANPDQQRRALAAQKGYALPDGSFMVYNVTELRQALCDVDSAKNLEMTKQHLVRRARALNRLDLIPSDWDKSVSDEFQLWGPHGEIISLVAEGGLDRNRGNAEKLRRYWTKGEGALKIGWNTPGDWYRCVTHLSKYLGVRAKGYCTLRHKEATGFWPGDQENLDKDKK